jgi:hypothetical protein
MALFKMLRHVDPIRADRQLQPRASQAMYTWGEEQPKDHSHTLNRWHSTWQTN